MTRFAFALALLAACGHHDNPAKPDASKTPDASIDTPAVGPNEVTVDLMGVTPDLIAYRDGDGPWVVPTASGAGTYPIHVTDKFLVLAVCVDPNFGPDVELLGQTFSGDGASATVFCGYGMPMTPPTNEAVTGQMTQAGSVVLGDFAMSATPNWTFNLQVPMGMHDLIAVSTANKIDVQHGLNITGPMTINVNLANAAALTSAAYTVNGAGSGDVVKTRTTLFTANEAATITSATGTTAMYAPASVLVGSDSQSVRFYTLTPTALRRVSFAPPGPSTVTLPPALTGTTFGSAAGDLEITLGTLPPAYDYAFASTSPNTGATFEFFTLSPSYLAASTKLTFDTSAPGFKPEWRTDLTMAHSSDLTFSHSDSGLHYLTQAMDSTALQARPAHVQRLLERKLDRL